MNMLKQLNIAGYMFLVIALFILVLGTLFGIKEEMTKIFLMVGLWSCIVIFAVFKASAKILEFMKNKGEK